MKLEEALYRLLHHRSFREIFFRGEIDRLGLRHEDVRALRAIDREQISKASLRLIRHLLHGTGKGARGLEKSFPKTLAAWRGRHSDDQGCRELMYRFLESSSFAAPRDVQGQSVRTIEDAFFRFLSEEEAIGKEIGIFREEYLELLKGRETYPGN